MQQLQAALQAYQSKDLDGAEAIFKQILTVNAKEPNALHLLGCLYKDRGQLQQAVEFIQASIREDDNNPIPFLNLGKILAIAGQHENAAGVFQESLKRNQQIPETWFCFANALREIEKAEEAKQSYRNALQLNPAHAGAAVSLGALLTDEGELEEAEQLFLKALEQAPKDANLRINYGMLLAEKVDHAAAIVQYQLALALAPQSPELHYNFANALKEEGEVEDAIASYRKAIEVKTDYSESYYQLYIAHGLLGSKGSALDSLKKCLQIDPDHYNARQSIGFAFFEVDRLDDAIQYFASRVENFDFVHWVHLFRALEGRLPEKLLNGADIKNRLIEEILLRIGASQIAAFGDSHVNAFRGIEGISINYLGAATAYNLSSESSSSGGGRRLKEKLKTLDAEANAILLCFGEIDCRAHVVRQAYVANKSIHATAVDTAKAYFNLVLSIKERGYQVIVYGPHGSGSQFNSFGLESHRNTAIKSFNNSLRESCLKHDIYFFSLNNLLVDPVSLLTRRAWLTDDVHLPEEGSLSDQVKVLLLSGLLLDIQSRQQSLAKRAFNNDEHLIRDVCVFGMSCEDKSSYVYARLSGAGLIQWQSDIDNSIKALCFDLGSSLALNRAEISLSCEDCSGSPLKFLLDGAQIKVRQEIFSSEGRVVVYFAPESIGRFLMISGYKRLSDIRAASFVPVSLRVK